MWSRISDRGGGMSSMGGVVDIVLRERGDECELHLTNDKQDATVSVCFPCE